MAQSNAEAHKATAEAGSQAGAGGVLHQRRSLPFCPMRMALGGFLIVSTIAYFTLYSKSKTGTSPSEVAKIAAGTDDRARHTK